MRGKKYVTTDCVFRPTIFVMVSCTVQIARTKITLQPDAQVTFLKGQRPINTCDVVGVNYWLN